MWVNFRCKFLVEVGQFYARINSLDPEITPAAAAYQAARVAKVRGLTLDQVNELVARNTSGRQFGIFGEARVNVLKLNLALDELKPMH
jgi:potassium-transporting ATPase KdpC subunit